MLDGLYLHGWMHSWDLRIHFMLILALFGSAECEPKQLDAHLF